MPPSFRALQAVPLAVLLALCAPTRAVTFDQGEVCIGGYGEAAHSYLGCVADGDCTGTRACEWGRVCGTSGSTGGGCAAATQPPIVTTEVVITEAPVDPVTTAPEEEPVATAPGGGDTGPTGRYKKGVKCQGAAGFPNVPYLGCEAGLECTGDAKDWGKICVEVGGSDDEEATTAPTTGKTTGPTGKYLEGVKCQGAAGFPNVPYLGCEAGLECTGEAKDWGKICVKVGGSDDEEATTAPTTGKTTGPTGKYLEGVKCQGAAGFPNVPYLGCEAGLECTGDAKDWGKICVKVGGGGSGGGSTGKYKVGEKCQGAAGFPNVPYLGCAAGLECTGDAKDWGKICVEVAGGGGGGGGNGGSSGKYKKGEKCQGEAGFPAVPWLGCEDGLTCSGDAADWGKICA